MADLLIRNQEYFSSIGPIAKKILQDEENFIRRYGEDKWSNLTSQQQDELLNNFFVDDQTKEKYANDEEEEDQRPSVFPKLLIPCGEKICVDFDNDQGWTWRDEHSGPFSWKTRSQQDLSLFDEEDEGIGDDSSDTNKTGTSNKSTPVGTPKRPVRKPKKNQSPRQEPKASLAFKPEKSIWDSPFLTADRGLDSAYPSSHSSDQSKGSDESDHGDMINKFGMAAAFSNAVREAEKAERYSMSACSDETVPEIGEANLSYMPSPKISLKSNTLTESSDDIGESGRESICSSESGKSGSKVSVKDRRWKPSRAERNSESEQALISELSISMKSSSVSEAAGHVSPVFIEDPGESSTDYPDVNEGSQITMDSGITRDHEKSELDDWGTDILSSTKSDSTAPKTGFDFLDNW